jgi:prepilin-type N-terminal cleavage/methylation domain-containing protein
VIRVRADDGFTLVELLVTMALATIVFGATLTLLDVFQRDNRFAQLRNEAQDNARTVADRMARQLRSVNAPTTGTAGALEVAEPNAIVFQTIDPTSTGAGENTMRAMRVRYCLNYSTPSNEILWMQVKRWTTAKAPEVPNTTVCPDLSASDYETNTQVVQNITNRNGGETRAVFTYPSTSIPQIGSVELKLFLDLNPGQRPGETQITSGVALRNANRPPTASFTATKINEHVRLNASGSVNPDGLALTYKWWKDGTLLSTTAQEYETPEPETKGTHTYELEIATPSGLSSKAKETVTIP